MLSEVSQRASGNYTVLNVHTYYKHFGGEDRVFNTESALLEAHGHPVIRYEEYNMRITNGFGAALAATWNHRSYRAINRLAKEKRPAVAHLHNTFPLISPSAYYGLRSAGIPVVQRVPNFRLVCPGGLLLRDAQPCEACPQQRSFLPALKHRCYRNSFPGTAAVVTMLSVHKRLHTYDDMVDVYVAPSEFTRRKLTEAGLRKELITVKPNFRVDPGIGQGGGGYALFLGRLSQEKGVSTLAQAWEDLHHIPLRIAGTGPMKDLAFPEDVSLLGHKSSEETVLLLQDSCVLVFPSICYECCPVSIIEAFACGTPVIASNLGSMPEFVEHEKTGLLFEPGNAEDLAQKVRWAFDHPEQMRQMRENARREYEEKYTPDRNYKMLIAIYEQAIENAQRRKRDKGSR